MTSNRLLRLADRVGCCLSVACAVHCLAAPLFITLLSVSPPAETFELPMIVVALAIAATTFSAGFVRHATVIPLVLLLVAGPLMMASRCVRSDLLETTLLIGGAVLLSIGHGITLRSGHVCAAESIGRARKRALADLAQWTSGDSRRRLRSPCDSDR